MRPFVLATAFLLIGGIPSAGSTDEFSCRHVAVQDVESGRMLSGIEDLVHHGPSDTLILSAHDRWGDRDGDRKALMGLFSVRMGDLGGGTVEARRLAGERSKPMRPHGITLARREGGEYRLLVIDHRYYNETARDGEPGTVLREYAVTEDGALWPLRSFGHPDLCPANDLDWRGRDTAIVTLDRANCGGFWRFLELARGQARGRVVLVDLVTETITDLMSDLAFPNGIFLDPSTGAISLTETREFRISHFDSGFRPLATGMTHGAPDNLSLDREGGLLVALHPDVTDFGLYSMRIWGYDRAATRLVRVEALSPSPSVQVILDDPEGEIISGATSVIQVGDSYIAGAAFDAGLAVCEAK